MVGGTLPQSRITGTTMYINELFESDNRKKVVICSGGFHPWTPGHTALYQSAVKSFPDADVWIAATNDTKTRPFPFNVKKQLAVIAGVPEDKFVQVSNPFNPVEITSNYDPNSTILIFCRSEKDKGTVKIGGIKKDGSPAYLQPYDPANLQPLSKHGYMAFLPTVQYKAGKTGITGATQIREVWPTADNELKQQIVADLYPATNKNPELAKKVVQLLDSVLGASVNEDWSTHSRYHSTRPGTKEGMPYEYSPMRYDPADIPKHWDKEATIKKWQDEDRSNRRVKNTWSLYNMKEDTSDQNMIVIPGWGQITVKQAENEIKALMREMERHLNARNFDAATEYNKKIEPFAQALKRYLDKNKVKENFKRNNTAMFEDDGGTCSSSIAAAPAQNLFARPQKRVKETTDVTDYNPKSKGGTRQELLAKLRKDPTNKKLVTAARRAGATQKELKDAIGIKNESTNKNNKRRVAETRGHFIGRFVKGGKSYILWQEGEYFYKLTRSSQNNNGSFETVKTFNDMSLDEVIKWLEQRAVKQV